MSLGDVVKGSVGEGLKAASAPLRGMVGLGENALSSVTGGVGSLADALTGADAGTHDFAYQPRTPEGQQLAQGQAVAGHAAGQGYDAAFGTGPLATTIKERIPEALGAAATVAPLAGGLAKVGGAGIRGVLDAGAVPEPVANPTPMQRVTQSGFQIAPNDVAQRTGTPIKQVPGSTIQATTETPGTVAARRQANVSHATNLAAGDIGLPNTDQITPEHIEAASKVPGAVYDHTGAAIPQVGSVNPVRDATRVALADAVADQTPGGQLPPAVKRQVSRVMEGLNGENYNGSQMIQDISYFRKAGVNAPGARVVADALQDEMENQLKGQPQTLADFQGARQTFAKIQDVQDSLKGGRVDPQAVLRLRDGARARPLSDGLADIAHAADMAPNSVALPGATVGESTPMNKVGALAAAGKKVIGAVTPDISKPAFQARIAGAARAPAPMSEMPVPPAQPSPNIRLTPPTGQIGAEPPSQLGFELAPGPAAPLPNPPAGPQGMPMATGQVALTRQILQQIALRNGQLPGTLER